jgi:saccharopine dehydrogenase-like NADP-dependent oxidoreductase
MRVLLLGVGMQGKAALCDLAASPLVDEIIAADVDLEGLKSFVAALNLGDKVRCEYLDAEDESRLSDLMSRDVQVAIDLLPMQFTARAAAAAVGAGVHLVNTMSVTPEIAALENEAQSKDVTILPAFGFDPGIDLLLLGKAVKDFDSLDEIRTYGSGIPEAEAADNPIRYKVTWTFDGVLYTYTRPGRLIWGGEVVEVPGNALFHPDNIHEVELEEFGKLEAFPSGDALTYAQQGGIDVTGMRELGRYTLRWPGHCAFWRPVVEMHLLDDEPAMLDGVAVDRKRFLAAVMEPHLQLGPQERDLAILRVEAVGMKNGEKTRGVYQLIDRRDLETGFTAMSRTVGFTASIGAVLVGTGQIATRGILSPVKDVPIDLVMKELADRGVQITQEFVAEK